MALIQVAPGLQRCPRCAGPMYLSAHDKSHTESCCLFCGEYVFTQAARKDMVACTPQTARARSVVEASGEDW
jgi:hypothetical protein